ncbi:MAG: transglutaminase-like domain-containing protein [Candidatus Parcubacteria bacterium]|nr:transglutaminase-like domain-containing protein [Candidatus Parcubacteria bacterium]
MAAVLMILASGGLVVTLVLLLKALFPGNKGTVELIGDLTEKSFGKVRSATKKGQAYVEIADKVLTGSQAFLNKLDLPPAINDRGKEVIKGLRKYTDKADALVHHEDLIKLLSLVSPSSSKFFGQTAHDYTYVITEDRNQPFQINPQIVETAKKIVEGKVLDEDKARALFTWVTSNIVYGEQGRKRHHKGYRHAAEVFADREGVCGEMAVLYVSMARAVGLQANYVSVSRDCKGDDVLHACTAVNLNGKQVLVDLSYYTFDIKHQSYQILSDQEAVPHFKAMRGH